MISLIIISAKNNQRFLISDKKKTHFIKLIFNDSCQIISELITDKNHRYSNFYRRYQIYYIKCDSPIFISMTKHHYLVDNFYESVNIRVTLFAY